MDTFTPEERSRLMSMVHSKDTKAEVILRKGLFALGFRYRKNDKRYPGRPDILLPKYKVAIFVNGCFWHGHEGCKSFRMPETNREFWEEKIRKNRERDERNHRQLQDMGWRVIVVWECAIKDKDRFIPLCIAISEEIVKGRNPYVTFPIFTSGEMDDENNF